MRRRLPGEGGNSACLVGERPCRLQPQTQVGSAVFCVLPEYVARAGAGSHSSTWTHLAQGPGSEHLGVADKVLRSPCTCPRPGRAFSKGSVPPKLVRTADRSLRFFWFRYQTASEQGPNFSPHLLSRSRGERDLNSEHTWPDRVPGAEGVGD